MKDYIAYLKFDDLSEDEILLFCKDRTINKEKTIVVTPNLDGMRVAYKNENVRRGINNADIATIDGVPVLWIAKLLKKKNFKYKISGSDLSINVIKMAAENNFSILLFGGKEGAAEKVKEELLKQCPNLIINTIFPEFGFDKDEELSKKYINEINQYNADITFLCTGFPKTEIFYFAYKDLFGPSTYLFVGATIDFLAGTVKRAPKWMSKCGLEWLYRLFKDFRRLFKRYWLDFWFLFKMVFICIFNKKKFAKMISSEEAI